MTEKRWYVVGPPFSAPELPVWTVSLDPDRVISTSSIDEPGMFTRDVADELADAANEAWERKHNPIHATPGPNDAERAYREAHPGELRLFDVSLGEWRPASQGDVDGMEEFCWAIQRENWKIDDSRGWKETDFDFKLAVYPIQVRSDMVFVAEDRPIKPYEHVRTLDGARCYPSIPQEGFHLKSGLPPAFAVELVRRWNEVWQRNQPRKKPAIAELEELLWREDDVPIEILPNDEVRAIVGLNIGKTERKE